MRCHPRRLTGKARRPALRRHRPGAGVAGGRADADQPRARGPAPRRPPRRPHRLRLENAQSDSPALTLLDRSGRVGIDFDERAATLGMRQQSITAAYSGGPRSTMHQVRLERQRARRSRCRRLMGRSARNSRARMPVATRMHGAQRPGAHRPHIIANSRSHAPASPARAVAVVVRDHVAAWDEQQRYRVDAACLGCGKAGGSSFPALKGGSHVVLSASA